MPLSFNRFMIRETLAVAALNAGMNAGYTSWLWQGAAELPLFGTAGIAFDLAGTPAFIGLLSTLFGTGAIRRKVANGFVAQPVSSRSSIFALLPDNMVGRALAICALSIMLFSLPLHALLGVLAPASLSPGSAVLAKVGLTLLFSVAIVPFVTMAAALDGTPRLKLRAA